MARRFLYHEKLQNPAMTSIPIVSNHVDMLQQLVKGALFVFEASTFVWFRYYVRKYSWASLNGRQSSLVGVLLCEGARKGVRISRAKDPPQSSFEQPCSLEPCCYITRPDLASRLKQAKKETNMTTITLRCDSV